MLNIIINDNQLLHAWLQHGWKDVEQVREFHEPRNSENDGCKLLREGKCCLTVLPNSLCLGNELTLDVMMYIPGCLT